MLAGKCLLRWLPEFLPLVEHFARLLTHFIYLQWQALLRAPFTPTFMHIWVCVLCFCDDGGIHRYWCKVICSRMYVSMCLLRCVYIYNNVPTPSYYIHSIYLTHYIGTTRTYRTPAFWGYSPPPHDYPYYWVLLDPRWKEDKVKVTNLNNLAKFLIFECWNTLYRWHTLWSCLIRCANMKWIQRVLLKIQSGYNSVLRLTDNVKQV